MLLPSSLLLLLLASLLLRAARCATPPYVVPEPLLQAFSPAGLQVSIPDSEGLQLFAFHGSVNKPMKGLEAGDMSRDVLVPSRGRWVFEEPQVQLLPGDVLYYWLYVQRYGLGYRKDSSYWIVDGLQSIPMLTAPHVSQVQPPLKPALAPTAQEIISTVMKNNCSSLGLNHGPNRDPLLYLLEGYEFVMVVKDGQLQLKDRPLPAETTKV